MKNFVLYAHLLSNKKKKIAAMTGSPMPKPRRPARFSFRNLSIRQQLPLLICLLLLSLILLFGAVSYYGIRSATLGIGQERLRSLTGQLTSMFQQNARTMLNITQTSANQVEVSGANEVIQKIMQDTLTARVELVDTSGNIVMAESRAGTGKFKSAPNRNDHAPTRIDRAPTRNDPAPSRNDLSRPVDRSIVAAEITSRHPDSNFVGKFYLLGDSLYYPIIATVTADRKAVGFLVRWRVVQATPKAVAQLSQLLGANAILHFGNSDGTLWTDMAKPVPPPPFDIQTAKGIVTYDQPGMGKAIASAMPVPGTKWIILVALSRSLILEAADRLLYWITGFGALLVGVGMFVAWLISRSFTRRLDRLSHATDSLASGDYTSPVTVDRQDELGKLATAFNSMALQVAQAQHYLEQQVRDRTKELETANRELESFSYSVSHDLRAPLRAVSGYAMILKEDYEDRFDPEAKRITGNILSNVRMMGRLIDDLIAFSRLGKREVARRNVDMKALAEACTSELLNTWPEEKFSLVVGDLPCCFGDEDLLKQVWLNLIGNALKYSSHTTDPLVEIGHTANRNQATWFVRDNGAGFDMKYADKLFKVFQRLHSQEEFEGTGIGLALVRRIIDKHKGRIWAESTPGKGAIFYFTLSEQ
jgi:signal transduction histidine kinase